LADRPVRRANAAGAEESGIHAVIMLRRVMIPVISQRIKYLN